MPAFDPTSPKIMYEEMFAHIAKILFDSSWAILDRDGYEDSLNPNKRIITDEEVEIILQELVTSMGIKTTVNVIAQKIPSRTMFSTNVYKNVLFPVMVIPNAIQTPSDVLKMCIKSLYYLRFTKFNSLNSNGIAGDVIIDFSPSEVKIADLFLYFKEFTNTAPDSLQDPIITQILSTFETLYRNKKNLLSLTVVGGLELLSKLIDKDYKDRGIKIERVK